MLTFYSTSQVAIRLLGARVVGWISAAAFFSYTLLIWLVQTDELRLQPYLDISCNGCKNHVQYGVMANIFALIDSQARNLIPRTGSIGLQLNFFYLSSISIPIVLPARSSPCNRPSSVGASLNSTSMNAHCEPSMRSQIAHWSGLELAPLGSTRFYLYYKLGCQDLLLL